MDTKLINAMENEVGPILIIYPCKELAIANFEFLYLEALIKRGLLQ
jgi:hypothetical protein